MSRSSGTPISRDTSSQHNHASSSPDELVGPARKKQKFTLEVPIKRYVPSNASTPAPDLPGRWKGWVELENNPMIFSTLLREWGAPGIDVHEIVDLNMLFDVKPESTYGLVLLTRWAPADTDNDITLEPEGVWFANQNQSYSCATVGIMNIIMNHPELDLGQHLNQLRTSTANMKPIDRGWALDQDDTIRDVHNSFGTSIDKAKIDSKLHQDFSTAERKKKAAANGKKGRKGRKKKKTAEEEEENGFHFIAYVPAAGAVWKMDGMEAMPRRLGDVNPGDSWLAVSLADLQSMWEKAAVNQFEVSLLSLVERTDTSELGAEIRKMEEEREDWGSLLTTLLKIHAKKGDIKEIMEGIA